MSGFKSETQAGVRSAFGGLAEIVGVAFGAKQAFDFGKAIVGDAASFQKQIEGIKAQFGSASQEVTRFGANAAHSLGISAQTADTVSARFGILFRNIGLGQKLSAGMTVGFEKLAGSLAAIKGVDPTEALQSMVLAAAGNVRGLKQLGISIDQNQIKIAALKLGLISNIKDGLTPGIRAQAIYALATANLGAFQDQARKHAGDLANVQRRLSAEWSNAKGILGEGLLPIFTNLARELEKWLNHMVKSGRLQHDFNKIVATTKKVVEDVTDAIRTGWTIFQTAAGWVGGAKKALELFLAVIAVRKIQAIAASIRTDLVANGFRVLQVATAEEQAAYIAAFGEMEVATLGLAATIRGALISTGIGAIAVALGLAAVEVINHWSTVKRWFTEFGSYILKTLDAAWAAIVEGAKAAFQSLLQIVLGPIEVILAVFAKLPLGMGKPFKRGLDAIQGFISGFNPDFSKITKAFNDGGVHAGNDYVNGVRKGLQPLPGLLNAVRDAVRTTVQGKRLPDAFAKSPIPELTVALQPRGVTEAAKKVAHAAVTAMTTVVGDGVGKLAKNMGDAMTSALDAAQKRIADSVIAAKNNLDTIGQQLADSINRFREKLGGGLGSLSSPAQKQLNALIQDIATGRATPDLVRRATALQNQISASQGVGADAADAVKRHFADLTDEFRRGSLTLPQFHKRIAELLKANGLNYKTAGKVLGVAFADGYKSQVSGIFEQAKAIAALPAKDRRIGNATGDIAIVHPLQVISQENKRIATLASKQRERMIKAQERAAKAAEKSAALAKQEADTKLGTPPGPKKARDASRNRHGH